MIGSIFGRGPRKRLGASGLEYQKVLFKPE